VLRARSLPLYKSHVGLPAKKRAERSGQSTKHRFPRPQTAPLTARRWGKLSSLDIADSDLSGIGRRVFFLRPWRAATTHAETALPRAPIPQIPLLAQRELAELIGLRRNMPAPNLIGGEATGLEVALACALALGMPLDDFFPARPATRTRHARRARVLYRALRSDRARAGASYVAN